MSFRNPFITDYIYQASDETVGSNAGVCTVFEKYASLSAKVDERGYGYYAGVLRSTVWGISDLQIDDLVRDLGLATKVPFRLSILIESGPALTYEIAPPQKITY